MSKVHTTKSAIKGPKITNVKLFKWENEQPNQYTKKKWTKCVTCVIKCYDKKKSKIIFRVRCLEMRWDFWIMFGLKYILYRTMQSWTSSTVCSRHFTCSQCDVNHTHYHQPFFFYYDILLQPEIFLIIA